MSEIGSENNKDIHPVNIEDELRQSYLAYAMSVIVGRALPDVRDGLKPVHKRVLFAMSELNNTYNRPYVKSARVVGEVIGKYHPHGDLPFKPSSAERMAYFRARLLASGISASIRKSRGEDISAACGMLAATDSEHNDK